MQFTWKKSRKYNFFYKISITLLYFFLLFLLLLQFKIQHDLTQRFFGKLYSLHLLPPLSLISAHTFISSRSLWQKSISKINHVKIHCKLGLFGNKAGYTATPVACGWAGVVIELTEAFGQELWAQKAQKRQKSEKGTNRPMEGPMDRRIDMAGCRVV